MFQVHYSLLYKQFLGTLKVKAVHICMPWGVVALRISLYYLLLFLYIHCPLYWHCHSMQYSYKYAAWFQGSIHADLVRFASFRLMVLNIVQCSGTLLNTAQLPLQ